MAHLLYYQTERIEFGDDYKREIGGSYEMTIVIKKLLRHYKLENVRIDFTSGRNHSRAGRWCIIINVSQNNFGTICHEVAHVYQFRKDKRDTGEHWHTKKHRKIVKRMLAYCKKKNWFEAELQRRTAPKPEKPEPSEAELRQNKMQKLEDAIKRHQTKIKRCQTLIAKANRRLAHLKRFVILGE